MNEKFFLKRLCEELTNYKATDGDESIALHPASIHLAMELFEHYFALKNIAKRLTDEGVDVLDMIVKKIMAEMDADKSVQIDIADINKKGD